jgi:prepilin-type N-terminal cleavage/methylation domain-containing protein
MKVRSPLSGFTLLEMLVATAVFSLLIVVLLQMTSALLSNASRTDDNLKIDQDVKVLFDLMRRDLAQARIGTNQNQFYGTPTNVCFVSSSMRLKTNYVSDQRLVTYFWENHTIYRAVVDPTLSNYSSNIWNPLITNWWTNTKWTNEVGTNKEIIVEGVYPYNASYPNPFTYVLANGNRTDITTATNPPRGLTIGFSVASRSAIAQAGGNVTDTNKLKQLKYDVDLNIPPVFNP